MVRTVAFVGDGIVGRIFDVQYLAADYRCGNGSDVERMIFMQRTKQRKHAGFTLIELLIVIAIIGILATVVIPKFGGAADRAKVAKIQADLHSVGTAVAMYQVDTGKYPSSLDELVNTTDASKGYLEAAPKAPDNESYDTSKLATKGEVTYSYKGTTYSSHGGPSGK